ncbi:hypothetical protein F0344_04820 [Streptomyces finlayi]|uniref:Uncharacterized protein n=1 Tax=Streptomyces finlayi TaxID=67296 RepID=A0A7G7BFA0_9ACTN|nr:hypothetical protein [Streptomyces finlayi]QNE74015.1 hypothetical protein F0344_04820 [Streptomyces finlayi]
MARKSIWAKDEENKPAERKVYTDDTVGRLHNGCTEWDETKKKHLPVSLEKWRVSTGDKVVADAVAQLFGGTPVENEESTSENFIDVFTDAKKVPVIIEQEGIYWDMKQWINGKLVHHCDGFNFLSHPRDEKLVGAECGCPVLFADRKQAADDYQGPNPSIKVTFRFADDPELGLFSFQTGSWTLFKIIHESEGALEDVGETATGALELEYVEYTAKKGKMRGKLVTYTKPVIHIGRAYNDAIAE